jgi:hypothetical protein
MKHSGAFSFFALVAVANSAVSNPVLIGTLPVAGGAGTSPGQADAISIILRHQSVLSDFEPIEMGTDTFWANGASGTVDFSMVNSPEFVRIADGLTNGTDDNIALFVDSGGSCSWSRSGT